jgi:hypothetical protein
MTDGRYANPADVLFLDIIHHKEEMIIERAEEQQRFRIRYLYERYQRSIFHRRIHALIQSPPETLVTPTMLTGRSNIYRQSSFLLAREFKNQLRSPTVQAARILSSIFLAVFISLVFINVNQPGRPVFAIFQNISGALFFVIINQLFSSMNAVLTAFAEERPVFVREYSSGYYKLAPYFLAHILIDVCFPCFISLATLYMI